MNEFEATNDDFRHLDDGLPPEIQRLKDAGQLRRAIRLIEGELRAGTRPELVSCLRAERARMLRTPLDFCVTREAALEQVRAEWPDFSEDDLDRLVPAKCPQVCDIQLRDATSGVQVAPADAPQRTAYWEACGEREFYVDYEYTIRAPYVDLWCEEPAPAEKDARFASAPAPEVVDIAEQRPHVTFTPYLRELADRLFATIPADDALGRARAAYDYVTNNVDYRFQPEYLLLDPIADSCVKSLRGDCGVFAVTFITLCRLGGVPARWQSGLYAAPDYVGPHDWAMFYVEGLGWLWADCSFGSSARRDGDEARRRFYFGNLGPWRMVANSQFMAPLTPACDILRADPYDNQVGELVVGDRGLTFHDFTWQTPLVSMS